MNVEVNYIGVLLATISSMVVGSIWYAKPVFGNMWIKLAKVDEKQMEKGGWYPIVTAILASAVLAYVLAHVAFLSNSYFQNSFLQDSLTTAFWAWLGFSAVRFITHDSFEGRRKKLTMLTISFELVTFLAMGLIIGLIGL